MLVLRPEGTAGRTEGVLGIADWDSIELTGVAV